MVWARMRSTKLPRKPYKLPATPLSLSMSRWNAATPRPLCGNADTPLAWGFCASACAMASSEPATARTSPSMKKQGVSVHTASSCTNTFQALALSPSAIDTRWTWG